MKRSKIYFFRCICSILMLSALIGTVNMRNVQASAVDDSIRQTQVAELSKEGNIYVVSQDGQGDYASIQLAVNSVESGDTLIIMPGTYNEAINIDNKTVNLIGTDKERCIIQYRTTSYAFVPLNIAAGKVCNLTIYGEGNGQATGQADNLNIADWESIMVSQFPGYAIHVESNYSYGKELLFQNCKIISDSNYCLGMGCRGDFSATFDGCEFLGRGEAGCIYMHDSGEPTCFGEAHVTLRNCVLKNYQSPYVISMHGLYEENHTYLTFQNVHVSTVAYEKKSIYNDYNLYRGANVDMIMALEQQGMLRGAGYQTSLPGNLVNSMDVPSSAKYEMAAREAAGKLEDNHTMREGITYLKMSENDATTKAREREAEDRSRSVINIWNIGGESSYGWCGLKNTTITSDSFGNTLVEMNYSPEDDARWTQGEEEKARKAEEEALHPTDTQEQVVETCAVKRT